MNETTYCLIGGGKVARHLSHYLTQKQIPFVGIDRSSLFKLKELSNQCDTFVLLISDDQLESFVWEHSELQGKELVHFSGSKNVEGVLSLHPLMTFSDELYDLETYEKIPFISFESEEDFRKVFPRLKNPSFYIPKEKKALYHSLCVLSGNFSALLWNKLFSMLEEEFTIPREAAFLYMEKIMENLKGKGNRPTGPLARRDLSTINENVNALKADSFQPIYKAFVHAHLGEEGVL